MQHHSTISDINRCYIFKHKVTQLFQIQRCSLFRLHTLEIEFVRRALWISTLSQLYSIDNTTSQLTNFQNSLIFMYSKIKCNVISLSYCVILSWSSHVSKTFIMFSFYHHQTYDMKWIHFFNIFLSSPTLFGRQVLKLSSPTQCTCLPFPNWLTFPLLANLKDHWMICHLTKLNNELSNTINYQSNYFIEVTKENLPCQTGFVKFRARVFSLNDDQQSGPLRFIFENNQCYYARNVTNLLKILK